MGLFDGLFGKKNKEAPQKKQQEVKPQKPNNDNSVDSAYDLLDRINGIKTNGREEYLAKVRKAVDKVPGAEKYVLETQQREVHADFMNITQFTPISKDRFVVFDLETTGIHYLNASIVEIGAVRVENGQITDEFSTLVNPGYSIPAEASAINHITDDMLANQPLIYEVLPAFLVFVGDDVLAAHNMRFDYQFLANACMQNQFKIPEKLFDTMELARYWPEAGSKKLTALAEAAGIEIESAHRALGDARMTARLILKTNEKRKK